MRNGAAGCKNCLPTCGNNAHGQSRSVDAVDCNGRLFHPYRKHKRFLPAGLGSVY